MPSAASTFSQINAERLARDLEGAASAGQTEFALQPNVAAAAKKAYGLTLSAHRTSVQAWQMLKTALDSAPNPQLKREMDVLLREYGDIIERIDMQIQDLDPVNF